MASKIASTRVAALVGPYGSGKTTLLEGLLFASGSIARRGTIKDGNTVGDLSAEARARGMSVEVSIANGSFMEDRWCFLDCPGSIEFQQDSFHALMVADAAIVVVEPEPSRAVMVAPMLKFLDQRNIPHVIFINKVDVGEPRLGETLEALQAVSERPLLLRELPIKSGDVVTGYIDLVHERAYKYRPGQASELIKLPETVLSEEKTKRQEMLEHLADLDDTLLEQLLSDVVPSTKEVFANISRDLERDLIVPVLFGSAAQDHGIQRLLKALRHDVPDVVATGKRLAIPTGSGAVARVFKTVDAAHTGKLSFARVWRGEFAEGAPVGGVRPSGLFAVVGGQQTKMAKAVAGDVVAFGKLDPVHTGDLIGGANGVAAGTGSEGRGDWPQPLAPLFSLAVEAERKQDEVKLSGALTRLIEEDSSLSIEHNADTGQLVLWGQGEIHLQVALEKLRSPFNLGVTGKRPQVPYKETIKKSVSQHGAAPIS